ncbi:DUF3866 family protein [Demetria terragena]|uniref:DUF3866 family protein n=1 Tax=Demetria terragena TaxID=63959 RepID=UPI00035C1DD5|nr:DUF3866 family protein [Demetria terragena]
MIHWRSGVVESEVSRRSGAVEHLVRIDDRVVRALSYSELVGEPAVGDRVLLNVSALDRGLGTGGLALVVALPDRLPKDPPAGPGHVVKARYSPTQTMVLGVDEQESPHHEVLREADDLAGMPVVVADLHSAVPAILAGLREQAGLRVAYVMSDGGALPIAFSRTVADLKDAGWLAGTVTAGQAYGGDLESVNVHTGLLAAHAVLGADVVVLSQGPGNLGTGTRWGFSGVAAGEALNAAWVLGGRGVASLRVSQADERERHQGISHHSMTAYGRVARVPADLPVPILEGELGATIRTQAQDLVALSDDRLVRHDIETEGLRAALEDCPVDLRTMGRNLDADEASFLAAAAAGRFTAALLSADQQ